MNNFKQLVDSINNDGATKYIEFINKFFIFGFLTLFTGFKETFYSVDSFLLLIICISISTCLYLGVEIIVNITYLILKVDKQISEYIIDELKFAGNYITEKDPSLKKSNYVKYQTSIKRSKYIRSPQFFTDKIIKIINLLFATLIIFKITKSSLLHNTFNSSISPIDLVNFFYFLIFLTVSAAYFEIKENLSFASKLEWTNHDPIDHTIIDLATDLRRHD